MTARSVLAGPSGSRRPCSRESIALREVPLTQLELGPDFGDIIGSGNVDPATVPTLAYQRDKPRTSIRLY